MKRKKYIEAAMGPISDSQLTVAPPFWQCQMDLFGPVDVYVPGFERQTRGRRVLRSKCWIMVCVCPTTRLVNMQVIEKSDSSGVMAGIIRLACEIGFPSQVYIDQDRASMCSLGNAEYDLRNLQLTLERKYGVEFKVCPVQGHNVHGQVERVIRSVQESFMDCGLLSARYHATGLQTLCKLIENQYNNLPLGYHYGRDQDNGALLKLICPNQLRVGRMNKRALDGPVRLPAGKMEMLETVNRIYQLWFNIWKEAYVPKLMVRPKWFRSERDLVTGDLVYFMKRDGDLSGKWTIGMVDSVSKGADGIIREVMIKYCNASEQNLGRGEQSGTLPRYTERSVRKLVKIFSLEDVNLGEDLAELSKRVSAVVTDLGVSGEASSRLDGKDCLCDGYCGVSLHEGSIDMEVPLAVDLTDVIDEQFNPEGRVEEYGYAGLVGLLGSFGEDFFGCLDS